MGQSFYSLEELNHMLAKMKMHQRRDVLLCIDEILTALDTASPAVGEWKAARRTVQLVEGNKFTAMSGAPVGVAHRESALNCS